MDCVVPKPSEVLFLISAGLWAEIFASRALQSFENIRGEKRNANISTLRGFISKSAHQAAVSLPPCHFLIEKEVQKSHFQGSPPAQRHSCEFSKSWVLQGFCNPSIKNLTKSLFPLYWLQNQVGIYLKSSVHRLRKESFANAGRERQKCRFLLCQLRVSGVWDPENRNYTTKTIQLARLGCYSSERLWSGECV